MNNFLKLVLTAFVFVSVAPAIQATDLLGDGAEDSSGGRKRSASLSDADSSANKDGASSSSGFSKVTPSDPTDTRAAKATRWAFVGKATEWLASSKAVKWIASWIYKDVTENPQRAKSRLAFLANKTILIPASALAAGALAYWYDTDTVSQFAWTILAPVVAAYAGANGDVGGAGVTGAGDVGTGDVGSGSSPAPVIQYSNGSANPF